MARILVIDDSKAVLDAVTFALERADHEVIAVADGVAGQELLSSATVDLAIIDIWMPGIDGISLLKEIAKNRPDLPVIIMSGGGPDSSLEVASARADVLGATAFLFKPFEDSELMDAVAQSLG